MSREFRWYVFAQIAGTDEFDVVGWSRTKEAARARVEKADPDYRCSAPTAFQVYAQGREAARKEAAEVFGVKVRGYMDKAEKKRGQAIVKGAVMREIFCPFSGVILDMRRAVVVETASRSFVMAAKHWDSLGDRERAEIIKHAKKVYDGRELFKR